MKTVLLLVHADAGQEAQFQSALTIAQALGWHLHCLDVTRLPIVFDAGWGVAPPVVIDESDREKENKAALRQRLASTSVSWSWTDAQGDLADSLLAAGRADLIVLNRKLDHKGGPNMRAMAGKVLSRSQALMLAVDEHCLGLNLAGPAIVAWDGSQPAWHALTRAAPVMKLASSITVFQCGKLPMAAIPASEAALHLAEAGIGAQIVEVPDDPEPAIVIARAAKRLRAGYCVMGAFGHGRLRETLFGGVTRAMLTGAPTPLLLSH